MESKSNKFKYPKEVIAISRGKSEARIFIEKGNYIRYTYVDPKTNKLIKKGKESIFLKNEKGQYEELFIIPLKENKSLLFKTKEKADAVKARKVWDKKKNKAVSLF